MADAHNGGLQGGRRLKIRMFEEVARSQSLQELFRILEHTNTGQCTYEAKLTHREMSLQVPRLNEIRSRFTLADFLIAAVAFNPRAAMCVYCNIEMQHCSPDKKIYKFKK